MQSKRQLYFLRRQVTQPQASAQVEALGAELGEDWEVTLVHAGATVHGVLIGGTEGKLMARVEDFRKSVAKLMKKAPAELTLSYEPGVEADIYHASTGVLRKWLPMRYGTGMGSLLNSWARTAPKLERASMEAARVIVAPSEMVHCDIQDEYFECSEKVQVVYPGFDASSFRAPEVPRAQIREKLDLPPASPLVLFYGNDWERQGLDEALRFVAQGCNIIRDEGSRPMMLVVGEGDASAYKSLIKKLSLGERVRFVKAPESMLDIYQAAQVLVIPTLYDSFAQSALDAMACGCPVVTTAANGAAEMVRHEETGFLLDAEAVEPLRKAVSWWLRLRTSPAQIAESVANHTLQTHAEQMADLLKGV